MNIKEFFPDPPPKKEYTIEDEVQDEFNEFCNPKPIEPAVVFEQVDSVNKVLEHMLKTDSNLFDKYTFDSVYETAVYINNVLSKKVYTENETALFFDTLLEDGRIVKNVNTTDDVDMDEIKVQARKMGFDVTTGGVPAYLTPDGVHPMPITESKGQTCKYCKKDATHKFIWADGRAYVPICKDHKDKARKEIEKNGDMAEIIGAEPISNKDSKE